MLPRASKAIRIQARDWRVARGTRALHPYPGSKSAWGLSISHCLTNKRLTKLINIGATSYQPSSNIDRPFHHRNLKFKMDPLIFIKVNELSYDYVLELSIEGYICPQIHIFPSKLGIIITIWEPIYVRHNVDSSKIKFVLFLQFQPWRCFDNWQ